MNMKTLKKYWPVLLLIAVGIIIYIRRKTDKTVPASTANSGNTTPVEWGADPTPSTGIAPGAPVPGTGGNSSSGTVGTGTVGTSMSDRYAETGPWMYNPVPGTNGIDAPATGNYAIVNFGS